VNKQQLIDVVKGLLIAGGPVTVMLTNLFGFEQGPAERIVQGLAGLVSIFGIIWLAVSRTDAAMIKDAASVKGAQVHINEETAPASVVKLAEDVKVKDVFPMEGGPRVPPKDDNVQLGPAPDHPTTYRN
jgi:hypothetical protein